MTRLEKMIKKINELMYKPENIRNIGICAHIDHGKTTLSDNLLAGAGMISQNLSGEKRELDNKQDEIDRGITIDAANVSMVQKYYDDEYLINLIDTPGHVDFGGDVTRAMRAVDGAVVVVCAVEGIMPQTETVLRQALKEKVKPVLFINKVDRLINELKLDGDELSQRFEKIILDVDKLIKNMVSDDFKEDWGLDVSKGNVAFGSAYHNWAINTPKMQETGITFSDIIDCCRDGKQDILSKKLPLSDVLLSMVVQHLPSPDIAQKYRVPNIWQGNIESEEGKSMIEANPSGLLAGMITNVVVNKHMGTIATCRVYGGTLKKGSEVYLVGSKYTARVQQVGVFFGSQTIDTDKVPAGNIAYVTGIKEAVAGETLCFKKNKILEFEPIDHTQEPVVTIAVKSKNTKDLPKLIEVLRQVAKEDPTVKIDINENTGEQLISGMGELHLEIIANRIENDKNLKIDTSPPIVVYKESILSKSGPIEGKSPNKHNRFYIEIEPLSEDIQNAFCENKIKEGKIKSKEFAHEFIELGMDKDEAKRIWDIRNKSVFINMARGVQYLDEVKELLIEGFENTLKKGPLANEEISGLKIKLVDAKLHEDAVHRGPAQIIPAIEKAIYASIILAEPILLEPVQKVFISTPSKYIGQCSKEIQNRRGIIINQELKGDMVDIESEVPIAEMFGFAGEIRSATSGTGLWSTEMGDFKILPNSLIKSTISQIRRRKELSEELPTVEQYLG